MFDNAIGSLQQLTAIGMPRMHFQHHRIPFRSYPVNRWLLYYWIWFPLGYHTYRDNIKLFLNWYGATRRPTIPYIAPSISFLVNGIGGCAPPSGQKDLCCKLLANRWFCLSGGTILSFMYIIWSSYQVIYKDNVMVDMTDIDLWGRRLSCIHSHFWLLITGTVKNSASRFLFYPSWVSLIQFLI